MAEKSWTDGQTSAWMILAFVIGMIAGGLAGNVLGYNDGYKKGQVDALLNNVKYELVINPDSTRTWEYKK